MVHGVNMGPTWGRPDPGGPPCWPHEHCYLGMYTVVVSSYTYVICVIATIIIFSICSWFSFGFILCTPSIGRNRKFLQWWCHDMETLSVLLSLRAENHRLLLHKGQRCGSLMFSLLLAGTVEQHNRIADDLGRFNLARPNNACVYQ